MHIVHAGPSNPGWGLDILLWCHGRLHHIINLLAKEPPGHACRRVVLISLSAAQADAQVSFCS